MIEIPMQRGQLESFLVAGAPGMTTLRKREDALVGRVAISGVDAPPTAVLKLWARPGMSGMIRRITRTGSALREFRTLKRLHSLGVSVPRPYGCARISITGNSYTDAVLIEDLGECRTLLAVVSELARTGAATQRVQIETAFIDLTMSLLKASIVDPDHGLINTVVCGGARLVRLDFELAQRVVFPKLHRRLYGRMLGRILSSYTFAVQPRTEMVSEFAERLVAALKPPRRVLQQASTFLNHKLDVQAKRQGLKIEVTLPWPRV